MLKKTVSAFAVGVTLVALPLVLSACGASAGQKAQLSIIRQDVFDINAQLRRLRTAEPLPTFNDSAALRVQNSYYTADADPNKIWYVTLVALDGTPYTHFTTKGAPQPAGDQVTNPLQLTCQNFPSNVPDGCGTIGLPEPNGVHQGSANDAYVAILTTGAIIRFPGGPSALISDQPFLVNTPVKLTIDETQAISHTDTGATNGAVIPSGTSQRK